MVYKKNSFMTSSEAIDALFDEALPTITILPANTIQEEYSQLSRKWDCAQELVSANEEEMRSMVSKTLLRFENDRDCDFFSVATYEGNCAQVNVMMKNPTRFIPLRVWRSEDRLLAMGNMTFVR